MSHVRSQSIREALQPQLLAEAVQRRTEELTAGREFNIQQLFETMAAHRDVLYATVEVMQRVQATSQTPLPLITSYARDIYVEFSAHVHAIAWMQLPLLKNAVEHQSRKFRLTAQQSEDLYQDGYIGLTRIISKGEPDRGSLRAFLHVGLHRVLERETMRLRYPELGLLSIQRYFRIRKMEESLLQRYKDAVAGRERDIAIIWDLQGNVELPDEDELEKLISLVHGYKGRPYRKNVRAARKLIGIAEIDQRFEKEDLVPDERQTVEELELAFNQQSGIERMLKRLRHADPTNYHVLDLLYGDGLTYQEAASFLGLTESRIRQREAKALQYLRHPLVRKGLGLTDWD